MASRNKKRKRNNSTKSRNNKNRTSNNTKATSRTGASAVTRSMESANRSTSRANKNVKSTGPIRKGKELKNTKKNSKKRATVKKVVLAVVLFIILSILIVCGVFAGIFFSDKFAMTREDLLISNSNTMVYDAEGNVILELSGKENRKIISIDDMSEYLPKAFVSIEDERFYQHKGVDIKRTTAATFKYITHAGSSNFGGSTITQQLIKNITNEKESTGKAGMQRKIKEMSRAYQVEKMLSKQEILQLYLNLIPLGSSGGDICGVEMASIYYFNKSAKDLTIEECAFIAGVTHSPSQYNPYKEDPDNQRIATRTKTVLGKMKQLGYINNDQYNEAVAKVDEGLKFSKGEIPNSNIKSYFIEAAVDQVVKELVEEKGMSEEYAKNRVFSGGLKIYTTMVPAIQSKVEEEYKTDKYVRASNKNEGEHTQSAMVIIEQSTGKVVGCMGGLGTDVDAIGVNRIESKRQPGSSIKPIGVYGPALEKGIINAATVYDNTYPTTFGKDWEPHNATNQKSGLCSIRDALEVSSNIVACKVMSELTPDIAIDFMRELGITSLIKAVERPTESNDSNLSTALGGVTDGISPLEMAAAYATIANNGVYIEPTFYTKVEDSQGNVIIESTQEKRRVFSEGNAFVMQKLLQQPVIGGEGTARVCQMGNVDVSAKTGTTSKQYDLWLCGFTPYYTAATWFGYDKNEEVNTYGGSPATLIWANVMKAVHAELPDKRFVQPSNVVSARICRVSGKCATGACTNTYTEYFVEGAVPGACEGHNKFTICSESKKIATEFCPHTETAYGNVMPEKEANANGKWRTKSGTKYSAITEKCDIHKEDKSKKEEDNKNGNENKTVITNTDVKVPNVTGKTESEAKSALGSLKVTVNYVNISDAKKNGIVASQSIPANSVVSKEAQITINVYKYVFPANNTNNANNSGNTGNSGIGGGDNKKPENNVTTQSTPKQN